MIALLQPPSFWQLSTMVFSSILFLALAVYLWLLEKKITQLNERLAALESEQPPGSGGALADD